MELLDGLNAEQREAVTTTEGYVRVIAGAGSGKTRALSHRFAYLVNEIGIMPGNILCVTFTNKSANEMRQRIHNLTGDNDTGYINTFHGFCVSVLQEDINAVNYPKSFLVLDNSDINSMLDIIYEERGLTARDMTYGNARDMIEIRKLFKDPDYYIDMIDMSVETLREKYENAASVADIIFYGYLYREKKCFGLDYNDLIKFTLYIFSRNGEVKLKWQKRLEYIMIDEFQDIDMLQYELMSVLCGYHKNLFIVGDPDQTIYTWRGANVKYLLDFDKEFPGVKTIMMMKNYRSTPQVIAAANSLIDKNGMRIKKELIPTLGGGMPVSLYHGADAEEEAEWMAKEIERLHEDGTAYREIAVLYRSHFVTRSIENVFVREKLPFTIYSGTAFFERAEIKTTLSYLRMMLYKDDLSFLRTVNTPKRNIGKSRIAFLRDYSEKNGCTLYEALCRNADDARFKGTKAGRYISLIETFSAECTAKPVSELMTAVLAESGYEEALRTEGAQERLDNLAELKQSVYEYEATCGEESTLDGYLVQTALFTSGDNDDLRDRVKLMTVHSAKGLEFPYVFLCAMNEGIFPSRKTRTIQAMEEERRLAFVAVTRAKRGLFISESEGRNHDGSPRYPSRFVLDIDKTLLRHINEPREGLISSAVRYIELSSRSLKTGDKAPVFAEGSRVRHSVMGLGTVMGVDDEKSAYLIKFDDIETTRYITFRAKLTEA